PYRDRREDHPISATQILLVHLETLVRLDLVNDQTKLPASWPSWDFNAVESIRSDLAFAFSLP
ncbi:MAG: hypothetical protein CL444_10700, partial [Acidimicrobiaceae bacterium]|nr:hypothetical protein [Acidimicrobiaceae bacterium]